MRPVIAFPNIDPVIIQIGPFAIRWYALAFIAGLLIGWKYIQIIVAKPPCAMSAKDVDDFVFWATIGVVLGGRLGYVGFYNLGYYLDNPQTILLVWQGGMSFHGGMLGMIAAMWLFARKHKLQLLAVSDVCSAAAPIGLFLGRLANFINGELFGRVTDAPWGMVFPHGGPKPRHPSQIYEALLEGLVLFLVLYFLAKNENIRRRPGIISGVFLIGYGLSRTIVEFFRQPDAHIGFLSGGTTMGQVLSLPLVLLGFYLIWRPGQRI